jgi:hypothetical protein
MWRFIRKSPYAHNREHIHQLSGTLWRSGCFISDGRLGGFAKAKQTLKKTLQETAGPEVAADLYVIKGRAAIDIVKFAWKR